MALETVSTIYDLVATNPTAGDPVSQADDHMRNIKAALLASLAFVVASSSYQKVGKFIIQVGSGTTSGAGTSTVTYPLAFPNGTLFAHACLLTSSVNAPFFVNADGGSTTGMSVFACNTAGTGTTVSYKWIAVGY